MVVCMSAKNYSYETQNKITKESSGRCTKIRGLSLSGKAQEGMDTQRMLSFVEKVQQNEKVQEKIPQMRIIINGVTKRLTSTQIHSMYSNYSNQKRFYNREFHPTKLWAYGVTSTE